MKENHFQIAKKAQGVALDWWGIPLVFQGLDHIINRWDLATQSLHELFHGRHHLQDIYVFLE